MDTYSLAVFYLHWTESSVSDVSVPTGRAFTMSFEPGEQSLPSTSEYDRLRPYSSDPSLQGFELFANALTNLSETFQAETLAGQPEQSQIGDSNGVNDSERSLGIRVRSVLNF